MSYAVRHSDTVVYTNIELVLYFADGSGACECVSRQEIETELASLREDVDDRVGELFTQLQYWQDLSTRILNDQLSSCSSGINIYDRLQKCVMCT